MGASLGHPGIRPAGFARHEGCQSGDRRHRSIGVGRLPGRGAWLSRRLDCGGKDKPVLRCTGIGRLPGPSALSQARDRGFSRWRSGRNRRGTSGHRRTGHLCTNRKRPGSAWLGRRSIQTRDRRSVRGSWGVGGRLRGGACGILLRRRSGLGFRAGGWGEEIAENGCEGSRIGEASGFLLAAAARRSSSGGRCRGRQECLSKIR